MNFSAGISKSWRVLYSKNTDFVRPLYSFSFKASFGKKTLFKIWPNWVCFNFRGNEVSKGNCWFKDLEFITDIANTEKKRNIKVRVLVGGGAMGASTPINFWQRVHALDSF